jgi:hypothetical protein
MNTLKINIPDGFVVDKFDNTTGEITFKPKPLDIKERLKTFDDVLGSHNLSQKEFDNHCAGLTPDEIGYRKEKLIVAAYNEGKTPDFTDGTNKFYPLFTMGSPSGVGFSFHVYVFWFTHSAVGSRLVSESSEITKYIAETFSELYKEVMVYERKIK